MRERVAERQPEAAPRVSTPIRHDTPAPGADLMTLQRSAGNQAVVGLLQRVSGGAGGELPATLPAHLASLGTEAVEGQRQSGLPTALKSGVEALSGASMDDVRVHYNSSKPAELNAHAFAHGTDIFMAPGQEKHLPHEAWHVVQQRQGRVRPTMQL